MNKKHNGTYFLDLADNGYWLIKSEAGYRECVGVGDEGKKAALEKIERLNKGGQMSKFKEKELLEFFDGMCLFLANHGWTERDERAVAIRELIKNQPKVTEKLIKKQLDKYG